MKTILLIIHYYYKLLKWDADRLDESSGSIIATLWVIYLFLMLWLPCILGIWGFFIGLLLFLSPFGVVFIKDTDS